MPHISPALTFTDTNGTTLPTHDANWTAWPSSNAGDAEIQSNAARRASGAAGNGEYYYAQDLGEQSFKLNFTLTTGGALASRGGVMINTDTASRSGFVIRAYLSVDKWQLYRVDTGSFTLVAESASAFGFTTGTTYSCTIERDATNDTIKLIVDSAEELNYASATQYKTNQRVGLRLSDGLDISIDDFGTESLAASPSISSVTDPVKPGDTLTITGTDLDLVTTTTFAGVTVTPTTQNATTIEFTVPSAYTNGLAFKSQTVQVTDGSTPDSTTTTFNPPADIDYNGTVTGYDSLPSGQYSIFDDSSITVVDGDDYVVRDPSGLASTSEDDGAWEFSATGDIFMRILDSSDNTDGPDGTWTVERTVTVEETISDILGSIRKLKRSMKKSIKGSMRFTI